MYEGIMFDLARFLGAIYRLINSRAVALHYDGVEYTWNETGTLLGSSKEDISGTTLVSVITADFVGGTITDTVVVTMEDEDGFTQDLTITFSITMDANPSTSVTYTEHLIIIAKAHMEMVHLQEQA